MEYINRLREQIKDVIVVDVLTENQMWDMHQTIIWQANSFEGKPCFYPVYQWNNFFSFSILALILKKENINIDQNLLEKASQEEITVLSSNETIDKDITRIGEAHNCSYSINDIDEYCTKIADAMTSDIKEIEDKNPGYTNIIMCGGKDSLNLLLLPWKNPVLAISAEPNFDLVEEFIKKNKLDIPVERLEDTYDEQMLNDEILEACCRVDLSHWRWGIHLRNIVKRLNKKVVIWKGQVGDLYMSTTWKTYQYPINQTNLFLCKVYNKLSPYMPDFIRYKIGRLIQPVAIATTWRKAATTQGSHVAFIRTLADCLVLSAYHGPKVMEVFSKADLSAVCQFDIRPKIGKLLTGKDIIYPSANPAPEPSTFRVNKHHPELFLDLLTSNGIEKNKPNQPL